MHCEASVSCITAHSGNWKMQFLIEKTCDKHTHAQQMVRHASISNSGSSIIWAHQANDLFSLVCLYLTVSFRACHIIILQWYESKPQRTRKKIESFIQDARWEKKKQQKSRAKQSTSRTITLFFNLINCISDMSQRSLLSLVLSSYFSLTMTTTTTTKTEECIFARFALYACNALKWI